MTTLRDKLGFWVRPAVVMTLLSGVMRRRLCLDVEWPGQARADYQNHDRMAVVSGSSLGGRNSASRIP